MNKVPNDKVSFSQQKTVKSEHLDGLAHVNNIVYLQWVQEIAENHWNQLANEQIKNQSIWVALRHEIDYLSQAFLNDQLKIHTWIDSSVGAKSIRAVRIYKDEILVAQCLTTWVLLDAKTLKPKRINSSILALFNKSN